MNNELLPCPFCGGDARMAKSDTVYWVKCTECRSEGTPDVLEAKASDGWNRRANQPAAGTTSDQYRAELYDEVWQKARDMGYGNVTDALVALERMKATQPAAGEPIGKVELFGINMTYVEWRERKMPPLGTELYAAAPAAAHGDDTRRIDWLACTWRLGGKLPDVDHGSFREVIDAAMRAQGDGEAKA